VIHFRRGSRLREARFGGRRKVAAYPSPCSQGERVLSHKGRAGRLCVRHDQTCVFLSATRDASGVCSFSPTRGMARRKAQNPMARVPRGTRGRLSARHMRRLWFAGPRFRLSAPRRHRRVWCGSQVVSQLLAGHPSLCPGGGRRRPGAWLRTKPASAAPRPASRRLMMRPSTDEVGAG
jgi:hypothetical protein